MKSAWLELDQAGARTWPQLPLSILPNVLGFSMGGMAIVLSFAGSRFLGTITQGGKDDSYFIKLVATFFHFIIVQTLAIFLGLAGRVFSNEIISFFGYLCMCYAILSTIATAGTLFNTARIANLAPDQDAQTPT